MPREPVEPQDEGQLLLSFLRRTKEGKYATVDEGSLPYSRIVEESETVESPEEELYYSVS